MAWAGSVELVAVFMSPDWISLGVNLCSFVSCYFARILYISHITLPPVGGAMCCRQSVCLSVQEHVSNTRCPNFTKFSWCVAYVHGSVLWQSSDKLSTFGFVDLSCLLINSQAKSMQIGHILKLTVSVGCQGFDIIEIWHTH